MNLTTSTRPDASHIVTTVNHTHESGAIQPPKTKLNIITDYNEDQGCFRIHALCEIHAQVYWLSPWLVCRLHITCSQLHQYVYQAEFLSGISNIII